MAEYTLDDVQKMASGPKEYSLDDVKAMPAAKAEPAPATKTETPLWRKVASSYGNTAAGVMRGAGSIGATILSPWDIVNDALAGKGLSLESNRQRRADMDATLRDFGADTDSLPFQAAKLITEVAGTLPVGGILGSGVKAISSAPAVQAVGNAIASAGMRTGAAPVGALQQVANMGARVAGGAVTGGASAGLVNPDDAGMGALIGGAMPPVTKALGAAGSAVGSLFTPEKVKMGRRVAEAVGVKPDELKQALAIQGPQLYDRMPTVPQLLQTPEAAQLQRTVINAGDTTLTQREAAQAANRLAQLDRVAPTAATENEAANNVGTAIANFAKPAEEATRKRVSALFESVDPFDQSAIVLPTGAMKGARDKFLGPGSFGSGKMADAAIDTAEQIGTPSAAAAAAGAEKPVSFRELQNLRSSLNEAWSTATEKGSNKEAAALRGMIDAIDNKVEAVAAGKGSSYDHFPPDMVQTWRDALAGHAEKMDRFHTGPQAGIFRNAGDGQAAIQGAEIPYKFANSGRSQIDDAQAFKRLIGSDPALLADLQSFITTQARTGADRMGNLTNNGFNRKFLETRSGSIGELFSEHQQALLKEIGADLRAADIGATAGMAKGSNSMQNAEAAKRAMSTGLLDSSVVDFLAHKVPGLKSFTAPMLDAMRARAKRTAAEKVGNLLANPEALSAALEHGQPGALTRAAGAATPLMYRAAPLLTAD